VFRRHRKSLLIRISNLMAIAGLATVALAITGSVLLSVSYVENGLAVPLIAGLTALTFVWLWFVLPLIGRHVPQR
jgi:hypothetical protein